MKEWVQALLYGGIVGIANIIPGLSGGTMAVVLGIYDRLLAAVADLRRNFCESARFLLPIAIGAGVALLVSGKGIDYLLSHYAMVVNFFFIGVIVGSIPMLQQKAKAGKQQPYHWMAFAIALFVMLLIGLSGGEQPRPETMIGTVDLSLLLSMFVGGIISAVCMLIPGISGSFVLLLLGLYPTVIKAISDFHVLLLFVMGMGILVGLFLGAKLIRLLMTRFPKATYFAIMGFVVGSIPVLFLSLYHEQELTAELGTILPSLLALLIGFGITIGFERIKTRSNARS